jgi:hypothetical protein
MTLCDLGQNPDLPDTGGTCCYGAALYGPHRCNCWTPVYDVEQAELQPGIPTVRERMCPDCAYRPDSPERRGDADVANDADQLESLASSGTPFWCHDGIRRPVLLRHPSGIEIPGHAAAYDPPQLAGMPFRADGRPALLCAGWAARGRALAPRPPAADVPPCTGCDSPLCPDCTRSGGQR